MHITDILENVCDKSSEWTAVVHPTTGKGIYARRASLKLKQVSDRPSIYRLAEAVGLFNFSVTGYCIKKIFFGSVTAIANFLSMCVDVVFLVVLNLLLLALLKFELG